MTTAEILNRAADLVEPEGAWCRHESARDARGREVLPRDEAAVCWCAMGAIAAATTARSGDYVRAEEALRVWIDTPYISKWNDTSTQADVVAALRAAARAAEG